VRKTLFQKNRLEEKPKKKILPHSCYVGWTWNT